MSKRRRGEEKEGPYARAWDGYEPGITPVLLIHYTLAFNQNGTQVQTGLYMIPKEGLPAETATLLRLFREAGQPNYSERGRGYKPGTRRAIKAAFHRMLLASRCLSFPAHVEDEVRIVDDSSEDRDVSISDVYSIDEPCESDSDTQKAE